MLQGTNVPVIQKAVIVIYKMSADEKMREIARMHEKSLHDEASALKGAREECAANREAEIISKMRVVGISDEQISEMLSLLTR